MKVLGIAAAAGGLLISLASLLMKTSVHSDADYRFGTYVAASDTLNIGLLQNQQLIFSGGLAIFIAGVVLFGAGMIVEALAVSRLTTDHVRTLDQEPAAEALSRPATPFDYGADHDRNTKLFYACSAALIGVMLIVFFVLAQTSSTGIGQTSGSSGSAASVLENNGDDLAARMEAQADNIDALADNTQAEGTLEGR